MVMLSAPSKGLPSSMRNTLAESLILVEIAAVARLTLVPQEAS